MGNSKTRFNDSRDYEWRLWKYLYSITKLCICLGLNCVAMVRYRVILTMDFPFTSAALPQLLSILQRQWYILEPINAEVKFVSWWNVYLDDAGYLSCSRWINDLCQSGIHRACHTEENDSKVKPSPSVCERIFEKTFVLENWILYHMSFDGYIIVKMYTLKVFIILCLHCYWDYMYFYLYLCVALSSLSFYRCVCVCVRVCVRMCVLGCNIATSSHGTLSSVQRG